ncbi:uncharacterized protein CLUP02_02291 [Colletotrichum lupini]|uniref:Uncharacterized protein n=1 Tax=Colletotrichum lupini TaxID=145971 RepID=A0A9Q8WAP0_9PEZI|nr:uncharacterized protein CLUP02_02291 [Colletotrichum lupini]UQC75635.1 hypothetical protein CLUP02_02291 [Colletotrichum lupini]
MDWGKLDDTQRQPWTPEVVVDARQHVKLLTGIDGEMFPGNHPTTTKLSRIRNKRQVYPKEMAQLLRESNVGNIDARQIVNISRDGAIKSIHREVACLDMLT